LRIIKQDIRLSIEEIELSSGHLDDEHLIEITVANL